MSVVLLTSPFAMAATATAQELKSAYFQQGYVYRYFMNPTFAAERGYIAMPGLANMDVSLNGNVGLSDFLYRYNDPTNRAGLTTFMHQSVDRDTFLGKLRSRNKVSANIDLSILGYGFVLGDGFAQVSVGFHSNNNMAVPYELFDFLKSSDLGGAEKQTYRIENFRIQAMKYTDLCFNYSRQWTDRVRIGGSVKLLLGNTNLDSEFSDLQIELHNKEWRINANGYIHASAHKGFFRKNDQNEINGLDFGGFSVRGLGAAIDLGATWQLTPQLNVSAAVLDLGLIGWFNTMVGKTRNEVYSFKGFNQIGIGNDSSNPSLGDQIDDLTDDLTGLMKVYHEGTTRKYTSLATTLNLGGEYRLPMYDPLSFGVLLSTHINRPYTWSEVRGSANIYPVKWLEASLSGSISTYGPGLGFMLNFHPKKVNFFVGTDFMFTEVTPQLIPVNHLNANVSMGINFAFGG